MLRFAFIFEYYPLERNMRLIAQIKRTNTLNESGDKIGFLAGVFISDLKLETKWEVGVGVMAAAGIVSEGTATTALGGVVS